MRFADVGKPLANSFSISREIGLMSILFGTRIATVARRGSRRRRISGRFTRFGALRFLSSVRNLLQDGAPEHHQKNDHKLPELERQCGENRCCIEPRHHANSMGEERLRSTISDSPIGFNFATSFRHRSTDSSRCILLRRRFERGRAAASDRHSHPRVGLDIL